MNKQTKQKGIMARFISYYKPYKKVFMLDMVCALIIALVDLIFPLATRSAIENLLPTGAFGSFFMLMFGMVILYLLRLGMNFLMTYFGHVMGAKMEADMRKDIFMHLQRLSFSFFDNNRTGQIMSRVTTDLFEVTELAHHGPEDLFISAVTIVGSMIALFTIQWKLAIAFLIVLPFIMLFSIKMRDRMQASNTEIKSTLAGINSNLEGSISGIREAQSYGNEGFEADQFEHSNEKFRVAKKGFYKNMATFHSGLEFMLNLLYVLAIAGGGYFIMKGEMQVVDLLTFTLFINTFLAPVRKLGFFSEQYAAGIAGFSRMIELLDTDPEIAEKAGAVTLNDIKGEIEFDDVTFGYEEDQKDVLKNLSFRVKAGERVALVGSSGGGKTTICQLIPRFYDVNNGSVKIDGHDVRDFSIASLRSHIGLVRQDVLMFAGSIKSNIQYGDLESDDDGIIQAAKKAEIHDFILSLPNGYDTYVGERGVMLSGGQKQRIAIARVFLKNPKILILDEATSALDTITERKIQSSLDELSEGRTTLTIAHRLSTIENANKIIVVGDNGITEMGTHEELIKLGGEYFTMHNMQEFS